MYKIQLLLDNPNSWMVPYAKEFKKKLFSDGHDVTILHTHHDVEEGDVLILLSCEKKFTQLEKNKFNLVIHASDLPKGKGWSPLTHQILAGENQIPITLFEANQNIDDGEIYLKDTLNLTGNELIEEIRGKLVLKIFDLIGAFLNNINQMKGTKQIGDQSFYPKRSPKDSKLDINDSIQNQFNLLRVVDNERYPAYFEYHGYKYVVKIFKEES